MNSLLAYLHTYTHLRNNTRAVVPKNTVVYSSVTSENNGLLVE